MKLEIAELERQQTAEGFWDDMEASSKVLQKTKQLKNKVERFEALCSEREDLAVLIDMMEEEPDASMEAEIQTTFEQLKEKLEQMKLDTLLSGPYDKNNAIIALHAGAGGTEAQDWAQMLMRMYLRWAER